MIEDVSDNLASLACFRRQKLRARFQNLWVNSINPSSPSHGTSGDLVVLLVGVHVALNLIQRYAEDQHTQYTRYSIPN